MTLTEKIAYVKAILFLSDLPKDKIEEVQGLIDDIARETTSEALLRVMWAFDTDNFKNEMYKELYYELSMFQISLVEKKSIGEVLEIIKSIPNRRHK